MKVNKINHDNGIGPEGGWRETLVKMLRTRTGDIWTETSMMSRNSHAKIWEEHSRKAGVIPAKVAKSELACYDLGTEWRPVWLECDERGDWWKTRSEVWPRRPGWRVWILFRGQQETPEWLSRGMRIILNTHCKNITLWPCHSTPRNVWKRNENKCPHKDFYMNVHAASLIVVQTRETTQISINRTMEKPTVPYPHDGGLLSHEKEQTLDTTSWISLMNTFVA